MQDKFINHSLLDLFCGLMRLSLNILHVQGEREGYEGGRVEEVVPLDLLQFRFLAG